jgi:hypothetical protein
MVQSYSHLDKFDSCPFKIISPREPNVVQVLKFVLCWNFFSRTTRKIIHLSLNCPNYYTFLGSYEVSIKFWDS